MRVLLAWGVIKSILIEIEIPNNILPKAKHTSSSILIYRVGLDPFAAYSLAGWIEWTWAIPG